MQNHAESAACYPFALLYQLLKTIATDASEDIRRTVAAARRELETIRQDYNERLFRATTIQEQLVVSALFLLFLELGLNELPDDLSQLADLRGALAASIAMITRIRYKLEEITFQYLPANGPQKPAEKIRCDLSVDQLGILFKAADESRLIRSRSLSLIFKTVSPYLSTPQRQSISWDSMRSKAYQAEERDKQTVLATLDSLKKFVEKM